MSESTFVKSVDTNCARCGHDWEDHTKESCIWRKHGARYACNRLRLKPMAGRPGKPLLFSGVFGRPQKLDKFCGYAIIIV